MSSDPHNPRVSFRDPLLIVPRILTKLYSTWIRAAYPFARLGKNISFHYTCDLLNTGLMEIGNWLTVHKDVWLHAHFSRAGQGKPVLTLGDHCFIGRRSHIAAKNGIYIGSGVMLAASVLIQDHGHAFQDVTVPIRDQGVSEGGKIRIGDGCWIGQSAAIVCDSGELILGNNCVVAANAVVTRSAPAYSVLSGNPARVVKQFDMVKGTWVLGATRVADAEESKSQQQLLEHRIKAAGQ